MQDRVRNWEQTYELSCVIANASKDAHTTPVMHAIALNQVALETFLTPVTHSVECFVTLRKWLRTF